LKADFPALRIVINGGLASIDECVAQLARVDGIMLGRAAVDDLALVAELDARIFGSVPQRLDVALDDYLRYADRELARGTPLRSLTRHLFGLRAGRPGGRRWRRELTHLPQGSAGLERLHSLAADVTAAELRDSRRAATPSLELASEPAFNYP
jgi:tRNA-dihydrouridine synthase A